MLLNEMNIFYHVINQQSFSKAAKQLDVSKSFISKKISKLEQELNIKLISRSTRELVLTKAGQTFYHYCANVVNEGEKAYSMMNQLQGDVKGSLKISIPPALALNLISPVLAVFLKKYPDVVLDIRLETHLVDLVKDGYNLALRSANLASSSLIAQKVFTVNNVICATEKYLQAHDDILFPDCLIKHNCAVYSDAKSAGQITLLKNQQEHTLHLEGNFMSNHLDLIKQLVLNDTCLAVLPEFMVSKELQSHQLVHCLSDYRLPTNNLYAIYPEREFMLPSLVCFLDMLKVHLEEFC